MWTDKTVRHAKGILDSVRLMSDNGFTAAQIAAVLHTGVINVECALEMIAYSDNAADGVAELLAAEWDRTCEPFRRLADKEGHGQDTGESTDQRMA